MAPFYSHLVQVGIESQLQKESQKVNSRKTVRKSALERQLKSQFALIWYRKSSIELTFKIFWQCAWNVLHYSSAHCYCQCLVKILKISSIVIVYRKPSGDLTFENFCQYEFGNVASRLCKPPLLVFSRNSQKSALQLFYTGNLVVSCVLRISVTMNGICCITARNSQKSAPQLIHTGNLVMSCLLRNFARMNGICCIAALHTRTTCVVDLFNIQLHIYAQKLHAHTHTQCV